jgi:hypothetical protein
MLYRVRNVSSVPRLAFSPRGTNQGNTAIWSRGVRGRPMKSKSGRRPGERFRRESDAITRARGRKTEKESLSSESLNFRHKNQNLIGAGGAKSNRAKEEISLWHAWLRPFVLLVSKFPNTMSQSFCGLCSCVFSSRYSMVMVYLDRVPSSKAGHRIITWMVQLEMEKTRAYHLRMVRNAVASSHAR